MKDLAKHVSGDIFDTTVVDADMVKEYFELKARVKELEGIVKKNGDIIKKVMHKAGKNNDIVNGYKITISVPDTSKFDEEKVMDYLLSKHPTHSDIYLKYSLKEDGLEYLIENGIVDLDALKSVAWIKSEGSPRMTISKIEESV